MNRKQIFNINQEEITDFDLYIKHGGYSSLMKVLNNTPEYTINEIKSSGLRGRGGNAFPTWKKLIVNRNIPGKKQVILCKADEREPGMYKDRFIMTHLTYQLIEGIAIAAYLAGISKGFIYIRSRYKGLKEILQKRISETIATECLGKNILGSGYNLSLDIISDARNTLCVGDNYLDSLPEIQMLKRGPTHYDKFDYLNNTAIIFNIETLANIPKIVENGSGWFRTLGTPDSRGTKLVLLSGDVQRCGLYEVPFGKTFAQIINEYGGGTKEGRIIKAVNIGGASGILLTKNMLNVPLEYSACEKAGIPIRSGALFVLDDKRCVFENVYNQLKIYKYKSCGKCDPCSKGLRRIYNIMAKLLYDKRDINDIKELERNISIMKNNSRCSFGQTAGKSLMSLIEYYKIECGECSINRNTSRTICHRTMKNV